MTYWQGVTLGIVQGLTEFLPISSSGHLVLAEEFIGLSTPGVLVEVVLHVATLIAVVVVYRTRLLRLVIEAGSGGAEAWRYIGLLALSTVPIAFVGFFFKDWFERAFESLLAVGISLLVTAAVLWSTRLVAGRSKRATPTARGAVGIGVAQTVALLPGISRSGLTVSAALWHRVEPAQAAEFSFLLSIPAILGAAVLQLGDLRDGVGHVGIGPLSAGFVAALVSGVIAIKLLVWLLRRHRFHQFAPYCFVIGVVTIGWWGVR